MNNAPSPDKILEDYKRFLYIVSHDLKAPVRHLEFFTKALFESLQGKVSAEDEEKIEYIEKSMTRLKNMQEALLMLSRVVTNQEDVKEIKCQELIKDIIASLDIEENIEVNFEDLPSIEGRTDQFRTVFKNLIQNSIIYNDQSHKIIFIYATQENRHFKFIVRDNGIGISQDYHGDVFDMFRRLHAEGEYGGGTGAGLTLVKSIIELHGGEIWLQNNENGGMDAVFTVPITT